MSDSKVAEVSECMICYMECDDTDPCMRVHAAVGERLHLAHHSCLQRWLIQCITENKPYMCPLCMYRLTENDIQHLPWPTIRIVFNRAIIVIEGVILRNIVGLHMALFAAERCLVDNKELEQFKHKREGAELGCSRNGAIAEIWRTTNMATAVLLFAVIINIFIFIMQRRQIQGRSKDPRSYHGGGDNILSLEIVGGKTTKKPTEYSGEVPEEYVEILESAMEKLGSLLRELEGKTKHGRNMIEKGTIGGGKSTRRRKGTRRV
jgi:hypothetical protein